MTVVINRIWAMPNHRTFQIKPINELLKREFGESFIDPFPFPFDKDAMKKVWKNSSMLIQNIE